MSSRILLFAALGLASCASARPASSPLTTTTPAVMAAPSKDVPRTDRKLVRNAWLKIQVKDEDRIPAALRQASALAEELGGYVLSERTAGTVLRIPGEQYQQALERIASLGDIVSRSSRVDDVTADHTDLVIRVKNARKLQARLRELLAQAENVEAALAVERELARATETLERLQGQLRLVEEQTSFATIDLGFEEKVTPGPVGWVFYGLYHGIKWLFVWD